VYEGMIAETVGITGHNGDTIEAYYARPTAATDVPGVIVLHHAPGWDEWCKDLGPSVALHADYYGKHGPPISLEVYGERRLSMIHSSFTASSPGPSPP